jgi:hypothetical protein
MSGANFSAPMNERAPAAGSSLLGDSKRWMKEVGIPLFIPPEGRAALTHLNISSAARLLIELQRLSTLGASWASAALATILIYPDEQGMRELARSRELLMKPAAAGDAYSLYVLAWAELLSGDGSGFFNHMQRSAKAGFSPAILDLAGTFLPQKVETALRLLKIAEAKGHLAARGRMLQMWMKGSLGWTRRVPGLLWFIYNYLKTFRKLSLDPLSVHTFCIHNRFPSPPIRRLAVALDSVR